MLLIILQNYMVMNTCLLVRGKTEGELQTSLNTELYKVWHRMISN